MLVTHASQDSLPHHPLHVTVTAERPGVGGGGASWFSSQGGGFWRAQHVSHVGAQLVQPLTPQLNPENTDGLDW